MNDSEQKRKLRKRLENGTRRAFANSSRDEVLLPKNKKEGLGVVLSVVLCK